MRKSHSRANCVCCCKCPALNYSILRGGWRVHIRTFSELNPSSRGDDISSSVGALEQNIQIN